MARNIVLCLDGTSNQFAANNTNVVKLYAMLDRTHPDQQLSYYQPGIGTSTPVGIWGRFKRWVAKVVDLAIAWFLSDHVCDAYRYLSAIIKKATASTSSDSAGAPIPRGRSPRWCTRSVCSRRAMMS